MERFTLCSAIVLGLFALKRRLKISNLKSVFEITVTKGKKKLCCLGQRKEFYRNISGLLRPFFILPFFVLWVIHLNFNLLNQFFPLVTFAF